VDAYAIASLSSKRNEQILRVLKDIDVFYSTPDGNGVRIVAIRHDSGIFDRSG
jgi:hypothetical protein